MAVMRATQTAAVAVVTALGEQNMPHVIAVGTRSPASLLADVHRLAWHYHWSEAEILALPRGRRAHYLALIDAARGMSQ